MRRVATLAAIVLLALGCSGDSTGPELTVTGVWSGAMSDGTANLTLTQSGSNITGSGSLSGPGGTEAVTVTGSFAKPNVSLTLTAAGFSPINYSAELNKNRLVGEMNGSGFSNLAVTLTRQ